MHMIKSTIWLLYIKSWCCLYHTVLGLVVLIFTDGVMYALV